MERDDVPEAVNGRQVVAPLTMLSMTLLLIILIIPLLVNVSANMI
jgi:hypothetical protein